MERYESTCSNPKCRHRWQWWGYKSGLGKTPAQLEDMKKAGKTCPVCHCPATVGLDHTSPEGQMMDESMASLVNFLAEKQVLKPPPEPNPTKITVDLDDGTRYSLTGTKLEKFLSIVGGSITFAQSKGHKVIPMRIEEWDKEK